MCVWCPPLQWQNERRLASQPNSYTAFANSTVSEHCVNFAVNGFVKDCAGAIKAENATDFINKLVSRECLTSRQYTRGRFAEFLRCYSIRGYARASAGANLALASGTSFPEELPTRFNLFGPLGPPESLYYSRLNAWAQPVTPH